MFDYIRDPTQISEESFRRIGELVNLDVFAKSERDVAMRLIHTSGDIEIHKHLQFSGNAVTAGREALDHGANILCDVEMLRHGLSKGHFNSPPQCFLNAQGVGERAKRHGETRCMTALEYWLPYLDGAIAVIGNAPTALFRLLEMLINGAPKPALIIGMPVGFVGAVESKQALIDASEQLQLPIITLRGRRGGSALAATTLNAIARSSL